MERAITLPVAQSAVTRKTDKYGDIGPKYFSTCHLAAFKIPFSSFNKLGAHACQQQNRRYLPKSDTLIKAFSTLEPDAR